MTFDQWWEEYTKREDNYALSDYEKDVARDAFNAAARGPVDLHQLAVNAVCPINQNPTTVFETNMVKTLEEFGLQVLKAQSA